MAYLTTLCQRRTPAPHKSQIADGTLSVEVEEVLSDRELRGRCLNAKSLGQTKNVNLPGVHVDTLVLTDKDVDDVSGAGGRRLCVWGGEGAVPATERPSSSTL